jgi:hypothetical protein
VHRHLVDVLEEVLDRCTDALGDGAPRGRPGREIPLAAPPPELAETRAEVGIGDDDEVPVLGEARGRRLLGEREAFLQ